MPDLVTALHRELADLNSNAADLRGCVGADTETHAAAEALLLLATVNDVLAGLADRLKGVADTEGAAAPAIDPGGNGAIRGRRYL
jgi:hypothetical protein